MDLQPKNFCESEHLDPQADSRKSILKCKGIKNLYSQWLYKQRFNLFSN